LLFEDANYFLLLDVLEFDDIYFLLVDVSFAFYFFDAFLEAIDSAFDLVKLIRQDFS